MNEDSTLAVLPDSACQSTFDIPTVRSRIGKQSECLWNGKFVFFCLRKAILFIVHCILSQACSLKVLSSSRTIMEHCQPDDDNGGGSRREEEYHAFHRRISERCSRFCITERRRSWYDVTKGLGTREISRISLCIKLNATDLCSEFSAQCLLSSVANVVDGISIETSSNKLNPHRILQKHPKLLG